MGFNHTYCCKTIVVLIHIKTILFIICFNTRKKLST